MELVEGTNLGALFPILAAWHRDSGQALRESHLTAALSSASSSEKREDTPEDTPELPALALVHQPPPPPVAEGRAIYYRLADLFASAGDALAHLHGRGILHRDLKPENLMLTADGSRLVIMDLGLALVRDRTQGLTRTGTRWVGTLRYCSPEQLQRNLLDLDERADVYGLGATLYEMLTLTPLFDGDTEQRVIEQVLRREPSNPRKLDPSVPHDLTAVVMACLDKDRTCRYASARELAEDLRRFRDGMPVRARPVSSGQRLWRWCRRNPAVAGAITLAVAALVAVAAVSTIAAFREAEARREIDLQKQGLQQANLSLQQLSDADAPGIATVQPTLAMERESATL